MASMDKDKGRDKTVSLEIVLHRHGVAVSIGLAYFDHVHMTTSEMYAVLASEGQRMVDVLTGETLSD